MNTVQNWNALDIKDFYLNYFKQLSKVGLLTSSSNDHNYYLVDSNLGKVAIISVVDVKNHPNKEYLGGGDRIDIFLKNKEEKPKYITKELIKKMINVYDDFSFLLMVTGCDDGHLAFYCRSEELAMNILQEINTIEELIELSVDSQTIKQKIKNDESLEDVWLISDVRN